MNRDKTVMPAATQSAFCCLNCGLEVPESAPGTQHRNHCPHCLWSNHVDSEPGDRASGCSGAMEPVAIWVKRNGEWALVHRCQRCGHLNGNRIAGDDNQLALVSLALRPLVLPAFPLTLISGARA